MCHAILCTQKRTFKHIVVAFPFYHWIGYLPLSFFSYKSETLRLLRLINKKFIAKSLVSFFMLLFCSVTMHNMAHFYFISLASTINHQFQHQQQHSVSNFNWNKTAKKAKPTDHCHLIPSPFSISAKIFSLIFCLGAQNADSTLNMAMMMMKFESNNITQKCQCQCLLTFDYLFFSVSLYSIAFIVAVKLLSNKIFTISNGSVLRLLCLLFNVHCSSFDIIYHFVPELSLTFCVL